MSDQLTSVMQKYFQGAISLDELEGVIEREATTQAAADRLLRELDKEFGAGRLPTQLYYSLRRRVLDVGEDSAQLSSTSDPTMLSSIQVEKTVVNQEVPQESTIRVKDEEELTEEPSEPIGQATVVETITPSESALEPTVQESAEYVESPKPTDNRAADNEATLTASMPVAVALTRTEVISKPPEMPGDTPLDFELPSQSSKQTGSNWAHPEQWTAKDQGPIGPGSVIANRYTIESRLGEGGMGIVFKARDHMKVEAQDSNPFIAIKILNGDFREHPKSLIALQREASKAQKLAHPNIVTVYDFSRDGTTVYMTMELMRGDSLAAKIRTLRHGGLTPEEARPLILEMAIGLAYAHKRDIVHSDFKPGNVFLMHDGRVKLLDFGIARAAQHAENAETENAVFDAGDFGAMTPTYASLEMMQGKPPHPADDVYALAVSAYTLLTGEHPFNRLTAEEASEKRLKPKPIKGLKLREWRAIEKGLAFMREERLQDADQFYRQFRGTRKITKAAAAAIVILALSASYFAYESFQEPPPPFPWEELSLQQQTNFTERIGEGQAYLELPFIGGAYAAFAEAFDIHPRNSEATAGLRAVAELLIEQADVYETIREKQRLLNDLQVVSKHEYLEENKELRELRERLAQEVFDL